MPRRRIGQEELFAMVERRSSLDDLVGLIDWSGIDAALAGVHAAAQTVHVDLAKAMPADKVRDAANFHLKPQPVAVLVQHAAGHGREQLAVTDEGRLGTRQTRTGRVDGATDEEKQEGGANGQLGGAVLEHRFYAMNPGLRRFPRSRSRLATMDPQGRCKGSHRCDNLSPRVRRKNRALGPADGGARCDLR